MQHFTIRDIENLTGIKAHTLRIWEQRYDLFIAIRNKTKRRIYDNEALKQLLRVAFLYHNGWKISKIALLNTEQITSEISKAESGSKDYKTYILQMIVAAVDFNEVAFIAIIDEVIGKLGFEKCITEVCYPYLNRVGMLWVTNHMIPAQEHFSSYIIQNKIIAETDKLKAIANAPNLLLFSPKGEHHELPLLFIYYLLKKNGWSVIYLGRSIEKKVLGQFTTNSQLQYLFLYVITNFPGWDAEIYFEDLCRSFPGKTIVVTGTATRQVQRKFVNLKILKTDKDIYDFVERSVKGKA